MAQNPIIYNVFLNVFNYIIYIYIYVHKYTYFFFKWWKIASINSVNIGKIRTDGSMEGSIEELSVGKVTVEVSAGKASTSWAFLLGSKEKTWSVFDLKVLVDGWALVEPLIFEKCVSIFIKNHNIINMCNYMLPRF